MKKKLSNYHKNVYSIKNATENKARMPVLYLLFSLQNKYIDKQKRFSSHPSLI